MSRTFAYCRVSTTEQTTDNQIMEIRNAGFDIEPHRIICENISGSVAALLRPGFMKLSERVEKGDVLVVTKLDRLGRNAMDVRSTIEKLEASGVRVHCLQLGGGDLTAPINKMMMQVVNAIAEFERDLLIERTNAGIARAKAQGVVFGRPGKTTDKQKKAIREQLSAGETVSAMSRKYGISRASVISIRKSGS